MALDVDNVSGALQKAAAEMTRILEEAKRRAEDDRHWGSSILTSCTQIYRVSNNNFQIHLPSSNIVY